MTQQNSTHTKIFVVDQSSSDYAQLQDELANQQTEVVYFASGRDALRSNPEESTSMWVINMRLKDMSGSTLHDMLRARGCQAPIALVGNEYSVEDELEARVAGASLYLAKPLCPEMFGATAACC
jgi:DNA-binding response OmpR family regulator